MNEEWRRLLVICPEPMIFDMIQKKRFYSKYEVYKMLLQISLCCSATHLRVSQRES